MAQTTKIFAPKGYHFMIKKAGGYYLMSGSYTPHTLTNGDKSSEYILMEYHLTHPAESNSTAEIRTVSNTVRNINATKPLSKAAKKAKKGADRVALNDGSPASGSPNTSSGSGY